MLLPKSKKKSLHNGRIVSEHVLSAGIRLCRIVLVWYATKKQINSMTFFTPFKNFFSFDLLRLELIQYYYLFTVILNLHYSNYLIILFIS